MTTTPPPAAPTGPVRAAAPGAVPCPACRAPLVPGALTCASCLADLASAPAVRLWQVEQRLAALEGERTSLLQEAARLRVELVSAARVARARLAHRAPAPAGPAAAATAPAVAGGVPAPGQGGPAQPGQPAPVAAPASAMGGQQLLLGLGAFLLLSGMSVFLWMVWDVIGLLGQACVMLVATLASAYAAAWATRRGLPAAAETAAVIASGLLALDVSAAWRLGLLGLDRVDANLWFGLAGAAASGVLVGFDRLVPARVDGEPLRRVVVYRPLAALTASLAAWNLFGIGDEPGALGVSTIALAVAVIGLAVALVAVRLDRRPVLGGLPASALLAGLPAGLAVVVQVLAALDAGYGAGPLGERMAGAGLLAVVPTALGVLAVRGRTRFPAYASALAVGAVGGWCLVLGVPLWSAPVGVLVALAGVGATALAGLALARHLGRDAGWAGLVRQGLTILSVALWLVLLVLDASGAESMVALARGETAGVAVAWWAPVVALLGVLVSRVLGVLREHDTEAAVLLQVVATVVVVTALRAGGSTEVAWTATAWALLCVALAWWAGARAESTTATEGVHLAPAFVWGHVAFFAAGAHGTGAQPVVLLAMAVGFALVACRPGRLLLGFVAVWFVTAAVWVEAFERGASQIEWFTLPPGLTLLGMGLLLQHFSGVRSSVVVAGPALVVGFLPSVLASVSGEDVWRTVLVTLGGLALLLLGCARSWLAPVAAGATAVVLVGWVQGGVLMDYLPGWSLLVGSGVLLLAVGVFWEASLKAGRRSVSWFTSLT